MLREKMQQITWARDLCIHGLVTCGSLYHQIRNVCFYELVARNMCFYELVTLVVSLGS